MIPTFSFLCSPTTHHISFQWALLTDCTSIPKVGLELTSLKSRVARSTDWGRQAPHQLYLLNGQMLHSLSFAPLWTPKSHTGLFQDLVSMLASLTIPWACPEGSCSCLFSQQFIYTSFLEKCYFFSHAAVILLFIQQMYICANVLLPLEDRGFLKDRSCLTCYASWHFPLIWYLKKKKRERERQSPMLDLLSLALPWESVSNQLLCDDHVRYDMAH